jgi:hypothetical protein
MTAHILMITYNGGAFAVHTQNILGCLEIVLEE